MKIIGFISLLSVPAFSAVTSIPAAPSGFEWQLVTSNQTDSDVVDVSSVETSLEAALGLNGSGTVPISDTGFGSATASLTAFGSPEPAMYSMGDTIDLVTANSYSASLTVSSTAGVQNGGGVLVVESKLGNVAVASAIGSGANGSDVKSVLSSDPLILISPNASATSSSAGSLSLVQGENVTFTFTADSELAIGEPFGGSGATHNYFLNATVDASLRRDTTFDTYQLVATVPEPSSLVMVALAVVGFGSRRRRTK